MENRHALLDLRRLPERRAAVAMANERRPGGRRITWGDKGYDAPDVPLMLCRGSLPQLITMQVPAFARTERICATTAAPSPIAPPTRLTEPDRTSPTANTPSRF